MPQMSPLMWLFLYSYVFLLVLFFMIMLYYLFMSTKMAKNENSFFAKYFYCFQW